MGNEVGVVMLFIGIAECPEMANRKAEADLQPEEHGKRDAEEGLGRVQLGQKRKEYGAVQEINGDQEEEDAK